MAPPLLFLATTDLFDDPRFEHGDREPLAKCLQYLFLLVKFGNFEGKREAPKNAAVLACYGSVLIRIIDLPLTALPHQMHLPIRRQFEPRLVTHLDD
jgi:hypothetical protein